MADDDDDWVGTPPEGHYTRDRARPDFWARNWPVLRAMGIAIVAIVVILVVLLVAL